MGWTVHHSTIWRFFGWIKRCTVHVTGWGWFRTCCNRFLCTPAWWYSSAKYIGSGWWWFGGHFRPTKHNTITIINKHFKKLHTEWVDLCHGLMLALKRIYHQVLKVSAWNFTTSKIKLNPNKTHLNKGFCMVGSGVYPKGALDTDICNTGGRLVSPYLTVVGSFPYGVVFFSYTELYTIHIL